MARINIEDSLFKDQRWFKLLIKCGDRHKALGLVTDAWILAQQHWVQFGHVPEKAWPKDLDILIEVELANRRNDGTVYVKGSKKAFGWLNQRSKAGKKLSEKKLESLKKARTAKSNKTIEGSERSLNGTERGLNGSEPLSLSLSPSLTLSHTQSQTLTQDGEGECEGKIKEKRLAKPPPTPPLDKIWNETVTKLPKVKACGKSRLGKMKARWLENPDEEYWRNVIQRLERSNFCCGANDRNWIATFDFLLAPETAIKVLEGKYDNRESKQESMHDRIKMELGIL